MIFLNQGFLIAAFIGPAISYANIYLFHVLALIIGLKIISNFSYVKKNFDQNIKINWVWIIILIYSFLSVSWAPYLDDAIKYCGFLICGSFLLFTSTTFIDNEEKFTKVFKLLSIFYLVHLAIALLEIFTDFRWPISEYSHLAPIFGKTTWDFPAFFNNYPTSFFWHQNNFALACLISLPFITKIKHRILSLSMITTTLIVILYSGSKSITVLSIGYLVVKTIILIIEHKKIILGICAVGLLASCFAIVVLTSNDHQKEELSQTLETVGGYTLAIPEFLWAKVTGENFDFSKLHGNIRERFEFMDGAIELWKSSPFLGIGAGGLTKAKQGHTALFAIHNYWLEVLVIFGPIIFILYIYWIFQMMKLGGAYREALILFIIGVPVISTAVYFLPKWLLYSLCSIEYSLRKIRKLDSLQAN